MKRIRLAVGVATVGALVAATPALSHIPAIGETAFEELSVTADGGSVAVSGLVAFGGQRPVELATDDAGDNLGGAEAAPLGVDLTGLALAQREPDSTDLTFELRLADLASPRGTPETVQYNWDVEVDGGALRGGSNWSIKTMGTRATSGSTAAWAGVHDCVPGGTANASYTCTETSRVEAVYDRDSKTVYVNVPMSAIEAQPGSVIRAWPRHSSPVWIGASAGGARTSVETFDGIGDHDDFRVPLGKTVEVGLAPAGSAPSSFSPVQVSDDDRFAATYPVAGPGTYDVVVRACFADSCATRTRTVEVPSP